MDTMAEPKDGRWPHRFPGSDGSATEATRDEPKGRADTKSCEKTRDCGFHGKGPRGVQLVCTAMMVADVWQENHEVLRSLDERNPTWERALPSVN